MLENDRVQYGTVKACNFVTFFALFNFFLKNSFREPKIFSGRKLNKKWAKVMARLFLAYVIT
jgi:hypothetical protein